MQWRILNFEIEGLEILSKSVSCYSFPIQLFTYFFNPYRVIRFPTPVWFHPKPLTLGIGIERKRVNVEFPSSYPFPGGLFLASVTSQCWRGRQETRGEKAGSGEGNGGECRVRGKLGLGTAKMRKQEKRKMEDGSKRRGLIELIPIRIELVGNYGIPGLWTLDAWSLVQRHSNYRFLMSVNPPSCWICPDAFSLCDSDEDFKPD